MNKFGIICSLKMFFQRKKLLRNYEVVSVRRSRNGAFSYIIGEPDDAETREAFRRLREWKREEGAKKNKTDKDNDKSET